MQLTLNSYVDCLFPCLHSEICSVFFRVLVVRSNNLLRFVSPRAVSVRKRAQTTTKKRIGEHIKFDRLIHLFICSAFQVRRMELFSCCLIRLANISNAIVFRFDLVLLVLMPSPPPIMLLLYSFFSLALSFRRSAHNFRAYLCHVNLLNTLYMCILFKLMRVYTIIVMQSSTYC